MSNPLPRRVPSLTNIYPGPHTLRIEEFFDSWRDVGAQAKLPLTDVEHIRHAYFICFTNRCGSNHVAEAVASSGRCARAGEWLNHDQVIRHSKRLGFRSYSEYLSWLVRTSAAESGVFGCKASPEQLLHLFNIGVLDQLSDRLTLVHVVRDDLVRQAVSMLRASTTKQWTSLHLPIREEVAYDPDGLVRIMFGVERANAAFRAMFRLLEADPLTIPYEEFVKAPAPFVARFGERIGLPDLRLRPEALALQKQSTEENDALRGRLLRDFKLGEPVPRVGAEARATTTTATKKRPTLRRWLAWLRGHRLPANRSSPR